MEIQEKCCYHNHHCVKGRGFLIHALLFLLGVFLAGFLSIIVFHKFQEKTEFGCVYGKNQQFDSEKKYYNAQNISRNMMLGSESREIKNNRKDDRNINEKREGIENTLWKIAIGLLLLAFIIGIWQYIKNGKLKYKTGKTISASKKNSHKAVIKKSKLIRRK